MRSVFIGAVLVQDGVYRLYYPGADPTWDRFVINLALGTPE